MEAPRPDDGSVLHFPGGERLPPESRRRKVTIRLVAAAVLMASVAYLGWRGGFTVYFDAWWIGIPMLAVEIHNAVGISLYTLALWHVDQ